MAYLLGIDIGTSGTKALVCDTKGKVLATATVEHGISAPHPGWSEQDPNEWWSTVIASTKAVLKKARKKTGACKGVGLSGQMHGSVFVDGTGPEDVVPLRPALLWNDQRTAAECAEIEKAAGGRKKLISMVGNPALTGFTAPKILWVRKHEPEVFAKTKKILLPKDYIRYRMTGEYATEVADASGTLLLDVKKRKWRRDLMKKLDLSPSLMPECYESHEVTGKLSKWAADQLGLKPGVPVVGGAGDNAAAAIGNGVVSHGNVIASLGTSGVVFAHADQPVLDPRGRVHTMCSAVDGKWCVFGCMLSAGGAFQWVRNELARRESAQAKRKKIDPYELMVAQAEQAGEGCEGLLFLPYLTGERCPHPDPLARGAWIGLTARHKRAHMFRAVMEGITFGMTDGLRIMQNMGVDVDTVRLTGGGANSPMWRQMQADIYERPVATINSKEGPAYGVAILAGVGTGVWKNVEQACNKIVKE
ncbi:MAG: xylulokinase, partial [Planctomycetota bacterium]